MRDKLAGFLRYLLSRGSTRRPDRRTLRLRLRHDDEARTLDSTPSGIESEFERLVARRTISLISTDASGQPETAESSRPDLARRDASDDPDRRDRPVTVQTTPEEALQAILADERFRAAPRTSTLLAYLVEKALAGEMDDLDSRRVAIEALGHPPDHDPARDPTLRILIKRLRQLLDEYYAEGHRHEIVLRIVPGSYRLLIQNLPLHPLLLDDEPSPPAPEPSDPTRADADADERDR